MGYEDLRVTHEWRRYRTIQKSDDKTKDSAQYRPHWFISKYGRAELDAKVAELASRRYKSVMWTVESGESYVPAGLAARLAREYGLGVGVGEFSYPAPQPVPLKRGWVPRLHQVEGERALVAARHGAVEHGTGTGKTFLACRLLSYYGLPAVIMTPTLSVAGQFYRDLCAEFGLENVGRFYGGKHEADKKFVVAVGASLIKVKQGSAAALSLGLKKVLIGDESHMLPADTLETVVHGLLGLVPYRFFLSGTQIRGDGLGIVLEGILGPVVSKLTVKEGVEREILAAPKFTVFEVNGRPGYAVTGDVSDLQRVHLYSNELVYAHVGKLVKWAVRNGKRVLILIDEVSQFIHLTPHLGDAVLTDVGFAHSGVDPKLRDKILSGFIKSDPTKLVEAFDAGRFPILVGTFCIGVGTDLKTPDFLIDLVGGSSETRLRQGVGRGTRRSATKTEFEYVAYDVTTVPALHRQAEKSVEIMDQIYGPVRRLKAMT